MDSVIYASFWVGVPLAVLVAVALPRDWRTGRFWLVFAAFFVIYYAVWTTLFLLSSPGD